ncbi:MAG TPA: patatin-like phospholipase family protein [Alphaproteobacteria bacterium]|nr:patatin-like phospholipase family protein [Alphaproteobacteria bacterium]
MADSSRKTVNLALQGGGSHGAFTWGVLDRLLEEESFVIEGISGTSAGALNGAALLQGWCKNGCQGARASLDAFWQDVGNLTSFEMPQAPPLASMFGSWNMELAPGAMIADAWQRMFSPYQTNPFNVNPLRDLLAKLLDIDAIRACGDIKLFVCATEVETGHARIFAREELTLDALMASACLPFAFQAVGIAGKPYWDGGYVGNPALFPLIYNCGSADVILVQINPLKRPGTPETPAAIIDRLNEITFNAALIGEMRAIAFVERLIEEDHLKDAKAAKLKRINMHMIGDEEEMRKLGAASKLDASMDFLLHLKEVGRAAADRWIKQNAALIGQRSSIDIRKLFLD